MTAEKEYLASKTRVKVPVEVGVEDGQLPQTRTFLTIPGETPFRHSKSRSSPGHSRGRRTGTEPGGYGVDEAGPFRLGGYTFDTHTWQ